MTTRLLLVLTAGFSLQAFALDGPNDCNIVTNVVLTADSYAHCENLNIGPGVTVVTHEFRFSRRADQKMVCGTPENPCRIKCVGDGDTYDMSQKLCGVQSVRAVIADGGMDAECENGRVDLVFTGYAPSYRQRVEVGPYGRKSIYLNDQDVTATDSNYRWIN